MGGTFFQFYFFVIFCVKVLRCGRVVFEGNKKKVFGMSGKKKILTIGGAAQDIYLAYQGSDCMKIMESVGEKNYMLFESGAKVEVEDIFYYTGGGATNSAVSFKRLGFDTACFCMVGSDAAGEAVLSDLKKENVSVDSIVVSKKHRTAISFVVNSLVRDRTIFAYRGANGYLQKKHIPFDQIADADQLYITSLSNDSAKLLRHIVEHAKKNNVPVAINPGASQLSTGARELKKSLSFIDILILNSSEAKTFMGSLVESDHRRWCLKKYKKFFKYDKPLSNEGGEEASLLNVPILHKNLYFSISNFFKEVMKIGPKIVVVTDGAQGVYVATKDEVLFHPSIKTVVADTLGAGDSFGSCFVGSLLQGKKLEDALRSGLVNSSSVIEKMGAKPGLLSFEEIEKRIKKIGLTSAKGDAFALQRYGL